MSDHSGTFGEFDQVIRTAPREAFDDRVRRDLRQRWRQLAFDLETLRNDGVISDRMTLQGVLEILKQGPQ